MISDDVGVPRWREDLPPICGDKITTSPATVNACSRIFADFIFANGLQKIILKSNGRMIRKQTRQNVGSPPRKSFVKRSF